MSGDPHGSDILMGCIEQIKAADAQCHALTKADGKNRGVVAAITRSMAEKILGDNNAFGALNIGGLFVPIVDNIAGDGFGCAIVEL
jgi:hypothetical protein